MSYLLNTLPHQLLLFLIVFTPLAFGSVHVWAYSVMSFTTLIIVGLMVGNKFLYRKDVKWIQSSFNVLILALIVYLFMQTLPLPAEWIDFISPETLRIHGKLDAILNQGPAQTAMPLSLNSHKSKVELLKLLTYLGIFFYIINQVRTRKQINQIIITIILVGVFETMYGMAFKQGGTYKIWWWEHTLLNPSRIPGTFINSNHLAGYLEMIILLALGFTLGISSRKRRPQKENQSLREPISKFFRKEAVDPIQFILILCMAVMFLGLIVSGSRGGMLALFLGLLVFFLQSRRRKGFQRAGVLKFIIIPVIILFGLTLNKGSLDLVGKRYKDLLHFKDMDRVERFLSTQPLAEKFWVTGTGLGTFSDVFPKYQDYQAWKYFIRYLHNDWLEWLIETGMIGFILLSTLILLYYLPFFRLWRNRKDKYSIGIGLGVMSCSFAIFIHSFYDFNLHIPANAFLFSVILGIGFVALHSHKQKGQEQILCSYRKLKLGLGLRVFLFGIVGIFLFLAGRQIIDRFWSEALCPSQINSTLTLKKNLSLEKINKALEKFSDNSECRVLWLKTQKEELKNQSKPLDRVNFTRQRIEMIVAAIRSTPTQANNYLHLGNEFFQMSLLDKNNKNSWLGKAGAAYQQAVLFDSRKVRQVFKAASLWLKYSKSTPNARRRVIYSDAGLDILRKTLQKHPEVWEKALKIAFRFYPGERTLKKVIPPPETSEEFKEINALSLQWFKNSKK